MSPKAFHLSISMLALSIWPSAADDYPASTEAVGNTKGRLVTPVNQIVSPAGRVTDLPGIKPQALALSQDGRLLAVSGSSSELVLLDPDTGKILQRVPMPEGGAVKKQAVTPLILRPDEDAQISFAGLAFSPDGTRIYLSNVNGDIKVFGVGRNHVVQPFGSLALPPADAPRRKDEIPTGIAVSPDGTKLYVAANLSNRLLEMESGDGRVTRTWETGVAPLGVVMVRNKVYVSNWGGRRPDAASITGPAGRGTRVRTDQRGIAVEGSLTIINIAQGQSFVPPREIVVGPHAGAMAATPDGKYLVAASAGTDLLSVIDTGSDEVIETLSARQSPGDPFGAQPVALAFDRVGRRLYAANGTQNAAAVYQFAPRESRMLGLIPTGWFPSSIVFDRHRDQLCIASLKGIAAEPEAARSGATGKGFNTHQSGGSVSIVPLPSRKGLAAMSQAALEYLRYPLLAQARLPARPGRAPVPVPERAGEPSVFKHVIYIIKENRTYDQVLGDMKEGNGAPNLCIFGERITPNQHKLAREFVLLDNTYCSGVLSADGHNWASSAMATDYIERSFAGWPRSYPCGGEGENGRDALAYSTAGFLWDNAISCGKSVRIFGQFGTSTLRWKNATQKGKIGFAEVWKDYNDDSNAIEHICEPDIESIRPILEREWSSWNLSVPDVWRARNFMRRLKDYERTGALPSLTILWLPNDHCAGTAAGKPTPAAMVADNDLAMGRIIEAVSRSTFWKDTCIMAIEDDPQNGWDHVSGYRTTAYVASAWTRRNAVVSTQYNQTSLIRTMELILGMPPMNQFDATATPMFECFTNAPDFTPFSAVPNRVPLDEINPSPNKISGARARKDAHASARLRLDKADQCDEDELNRILWRAMRGSEPFPAWAVKPAEDDD